MFYKTKNISLDSAFNFAHLVLIYVVSLEIPYKIILKGGITSTCKHLISPLVSSKRVNKYINAHLIELFIWINKASFMWQRAYMQIREKALDLSRTNDDAKPFRSDFWLSVFRDLKLKWSSNSQPQLTSTKNLNHLLVVGAFFVVSSFFPPFNQIKNLFTPPFFITHTL